MTTSRNRSGLAAVIALGCVVGAFAAARDSTLSPTERHGLSASFRFNRQPLKGAREPFKYVREVHPSLERISAWISSVGAGVALGDIDGDGLSNDVCQIEPRSDQLIVAPVPHTEQRRSGSFQPFDLRPSHYDERTMAPMGCLIGDLNEDGMADLVAYYWGRTPVAFVRQTGSPERPPSRGAFSSVELVPGRERWFTNAGLRADVDGDGHVDLLFGNYFEDGAHILDASGTGVETLHNTKSRASNGGLKHLLLWRAPRSDAELLTFDAAADVFEPQVARGWSLAMGAADLDGDQRPELYFANDFGPDRLLFNESTRGRPRFRLVEGRRGFWTPASFALGRDSFKGMGVDFGDVNGDGVFDIYVSNIADEFALQESHFLWLSQGPLADWRAGRAPFTQASERLGLSRSGWGWDARLADFDNDGEPEAVQATGFVKGETNRWPELQALGTGNDQLMSRPLFWPAFRPGDDLSGHNRFAFFARRGNERFTNITEEIGMGDEMVSRGIAIGDVDGDGKLDMVVANQWEASYAYHNESPTSGQYLGIHVLQAARADVGDVPLVTPGHRRPAVATWPAVGASGVVTRSDGRSLIAHVDGGSGHSGKRSPDLHFGLGMAAAAGPVDLQLTWRDRTGVVRSRTLTLAPGWHTVVLPT